MIYFIYCKNFCKCHNVPPPSITIKKESRHKRVYTMWFFLHKFQNRQAYLFWEKSRLRLPLAELWLQKHRCSIRFQISFHFFNQCALYTRISTLKKSLSCTHISVFLASIKLFFFKKILKENLIFSIWIYVAQHFPVICDSDNWRN
jgi:hypothetical protein